jgi:predicted ribosomally synthesized peptide with nif11-like leader
MSVQDAKQFADLLYTDPDLQAKFHQKWDGIAALAKEKGLNVSRADLQQHLRERWSVPPAATHDDKDTCTICMA